MKWNTIILILIFAAFGCNKDVDEFEPYVKTAISFPEVVDLKPIYRHFNAEEMSEIDLGQGDVLEVPANSIVDQSGQILSGKIDLSITQIRKKSDLIYAYLNSNIGKNDNGLLDNYQVINIKAYHESKEVFIKENKYITLKSPNNTSLVTGQVWTGNHYSPNNFGWKNSIATSALNSATWSINGASYIGVSYQTNQFGWISGAKQLSGGHKLCVNLLEGINPKKTKVYFIFNDAFTVTELKVFSDNNNFCGTIPTGTSGHLVIINEEEKGQYRYQNETLTITEATNFSAQPQVTVLEDIILSLNSL